MDLCILYIHIVPRGTYDVFVSAFKYACMCVCVYICMYGCYYVMQCNVMYGMAWYVKILCYVMVWYDILCYVML